MARNLPQIVKDKPCYFALDGYASFYEASLYASINVKGIAASKSMYMETCSKTKLFFEEMKTKTNNVEIVELPPHLEKMWGAEFKDAFGKFFNKAAFIELRSYHCCKCIERFVAGGHPFTSSTYEDVHDYYNKFIISSPKFELEFPIIIDEYIVIISDFAHPSNFFPLQTYVRFLYKKIGLIFIVNDPKYYHTLSNVRDHLESIYRIPKASVDINSEEFLNTIQTQENAHTRTYIKFITKSFKQMDGEIAGLPNNILYRYRLLYRNTVVNLILHGIKLARPCMYTLKHGDITFLEGNVLLQERSKLPQITGIAQTHQSSSFDVLNVWKEMAYVRHLKTQRSSLTKAVLFYLYGVMCDPNDDVMQTGLFHGNCIERKLFCYRNPVRQYLSIFKTMLKGKPDFTDEMRYLNETVISNIFDYISNNYKILLVGHSYGGALVSLLAEFVEKHHREWIDKIKFVTFGAVSTYDPTDTRLNIDHYIIEGDIVTLCNKHSCSVTCQQGECFKDLNYAKNKITWYKPEKEKQDRRSFVPDGWEKHQRYADVLLTKVVDQFFDEIF